jgi:hypothetical protein
VTARIAQGLVSVVAGLIVAALVCVAQRGAMGAALILAPLATVAIDALVWP